MRLVSCILWSGIALLAFSCASPESDTGLPETGESFGETCYRCHGNSLSPAPPRGIGGADNVADMGVGAHATHLAVSKSTTFHAPVLCSSCHLVPQEDGDPGHMDDDDMRAEINFGGIAMAGGAQPTRNDDGTCSNVYCHGATLQGGSQSRPLWNDVASAQKDCGACHGLPPPAPHPSGDNCGSCHPTVSPANNTVFLDPLKHINGIVEVTGGGGACDSCHGSEGNSAPPNDLAGNTDRASIGVGAHREHLAASTWRRQINCSNCHIVPVAFGDAGHVDGDNIAEVPFDGLNPTATVDLATGNCSNLYCHGNGRGSNGSMLWTDVGAQDCNSCHQSPSIGQEAKGMSGEHDKHIRDKKIACFECHSVVVNAGMEIVTPALHIDGQRSIDMPQGGDWNPANKRCSNMACHEDETW